MRSLIESGSRRAAELGSSRSCNLTRLSRCSSVATWSVCRCTSSYKSANALRSCRTGSQTRGTKCSAPVISLRNGAIQDLYFFSLCRVQFIQHKHRVQLAANCRQLFAPALRAINHALDSCFAAGILELCFEHGMGLLHELVAVAASFEYAGFETAQQSQTNRRPSENYNKLRHAATKGPREHQSFHG